MSHAAVICGSSFIVITIYWFAWARRNFKGPRARADAIAAAAAKQAHLEMSNMPDSRSDALGTQVSGAMGTPMATPVATEEDPLRGYFRGPPKA